MQKSAFLNKRGFALRTCNTDLPFSLRDADLLLALRARINMKISALSSISATATVLPETVMILTLAPLWLSWQKNGEEAAIIRL